MKKMRNTEKAFKWIVKLLKGNKIPFLIAGGFAVNIYGSKRKLADIDIIVSDEKFGKIASNVKNHIMWGPGRYVDKNWDLPLMTLKFENQEIDICSRNPKIYDCKNKKWIKIFINFSKRNIKKIYDLQVPVMRVENLVEYKRILNRKVDQKDVKFLSKF